MHPQKALLLELDITIKKLPPTLSDLQKEAKKKLEGFEADETTSEDVILSYLAEVGRKEYPHRHALSQLHDAHGEGIEINMILEHLDEDVAAKVKPMVESGVGLEELVGSDWFEGELNPAQRYQVEDGMLLARYKLEQEDKGLVQAHEDEFDRLLAQWETTAKEMDVLLEELESFAEKDARYTDEINDQVRGFRTGWSVTERDPEASAIRAQIAHWKDVFGESNQ